ncbi:Cyclic nucleotide-binding domain protein [Chitinispirillum alkaliphilum]|nr:Cyclic nucleotide-binding domain protein [Chitinispirillum alkaliphilum]
MKPLLKKFKPGQHLFYEKDRSRELYIIQTGSIQVYRKLGLRQINLAVLGKGAVVGEMSLIDGKPRSASAKAVENSSVIIINADILQKKIKGVPLWYISLIKMISHKIRTANMRLSHTDSRSQSISAILSLFYLFESKSQDSFVTADIKNWLIQLLGITHQRISGVFEHLHTFSLIRFEENYVSLRNKEEFREYCDFLRIMVRKQAQKTVDCSALLRSVCADFVQVYKELKDPAHDIEIPEEEFLNTFSQPDTRYLLSEHIDTLCNFEMLFCKRNPLQWEKDSAQYHVKLLNPGWLHMYLIKKHLIKYSTL